MATLFHLDVLRLSPKNEDGTQYIEIVGSGTLTTPDEPEGAIYPLPAEWHPMLLAISDNLRLSEVCNHDGVRRFFYRDFGTTDCRLILQVQPYFDYLVAAQQDSEDVGVLVAHDMGVDLRVSTDPLFEQLAHLIFKTTSGTLTNGVTTFVLSKYEVSALKDALTAVLEKRPLTSPQIGNPQWRERLNQLAEERVGIPYNAFRAARGEVAE